MQENKIATSVNSDDVSNRNLKPFLSVFIILVIIVSGYFFIWRNITVKMKNVVVDSLKDYKYESIKIGGFPFSKKVIVNDITFGNSTFLATKNQVNIKELYIKGFIFSGTLDIKFKNITTITGVDEAVYSLIYNEEPEMNISFYSNGSLKNFNYSDNGYRVINTENQTLYTSDKSALNVQSVLNGDTADYSIIGDFQNMQNISIIEKKDEISINEIPEIYNLKFDISSSITKKDNKIENSTIKINNFDLTGSKNNLISISGELFKEQGDQYSFGDLKFTISNYKNILSIYKVNMLETLKIQNLELSEEEKKEYITILNNIFSQTQKLILKNPETKADVGVIELSRKKSASDYTINGESLLSIIQEIIK